MVLNIPHTRVGTKTVKWNAVWNICIKRPERIFVRQFWRQWRAAGRPGTVKEFIIRKVGIYPKRFDEYAAHWLYDKVFLRKGIINAQPQKYGGLPAVIQEELDLGINRNCFDLVETIRKKRIKAGLSEI